MTRPPKEKTAPSHGAANTTRLPALTFTFVIISLVVLAATPFFLVYRLSEMRRATEASSGTALRDLAEIHDLLTQEVIEHQSFRLRADTAAARNYFALRRVEDARVDRLDSLADLLSPGINDRVTVFRRRIERWHLLPDARAAGRMSEARFVPLVDSVRARRDSMLAAYGDLKSELDRAELGDLARGQRLIDRQRWLSVGVGTLALLSALAVAWFSRRERALSTRLAQALDEEARLRAESEQQRDDLEHVTESRTRLIRGFTHDVKNPLGAADGFLQLLEDGITDPQPLTERQRRSVARVRRLLASALSLIGDLLEISRAETGHLQFHREPMDLCEAARELMEEYRPQAERKGLQMWADLPVDAPLAFSDPARVRQVLGNLVSNAVKYTERGTVGLRIPPLSDGGRVVVEVSDTGMGIALEQQRRIFQEFVRLDPDAAPGVGVGLAISQRIARAMDGDIAVRSTAGRGSTFVLTLPMAAAVATV